MSAILISRDGAGELVKIGAWVSTGPDGLRTRVTFAPDLTWREAGEWGEAASGRLQQRTDNLFMTPMDAGPSRRLKRAPGARPSYEWSYSDGRRGTLAPL